MTEETVIDALTDDQAEVLSRYRCNKVVKAGKIVSIALNNSETPWVAEVTYATGRGAELDVVLVSDAWLQNKKVASDGYLVLYEDGYLSYSPRAAFERGYVIERDVVDHDEPLLRFFVMDHPAQEAAAEPFLALAKQLCETMPRTAERTVALRKLLESMDAALRVGE